MSTPGKDLEELALAQINLFAQEHLTDSSLPFKQALLCPSPHLPVSDAVWRNLPSRLLIETHRGRVWIVDIQGGRWSKEKLAIAAGVLDQFEEDLEQRQSRLAYETGFSNLKLQPLDNSIQEPDQWPLRRLSVAFSLLLAGLCPEGGFRCISSDFATWTSNQLWAETKPHAEKFVARLNQDALQEAKRFPGFEGLVYNCVASQQSNYRIQFISRFPIFFERLISNRPSPVWKVLIDTIDRGEPLQHRLSAMLFISSSTLRSLSTMPIELARRWSSRQEHLCFVLEGLWPEVRPKTDSSWVQLINAIESLEARAGKSIERSFFIRNTIHKWLRRPAEVRKKEQVPAIDLNSLGAVDRLYGVAEQLAALLTNSVKRTGEITLTQDIRLKLDQWLFMDSNHTLSKQMEIALQAQPMAEQAKNPHELTQGATVGQKHSFAALPPKFCSQDGLLHAVCLTTASALVKQSKRMNICLGSDRYIDALPKGDEYFISIEDSQSNGQSTLHLKVTLVLNGSALITHPRIVEHKAHNNSAPSRECAAFAQEILSYLQTTEMRCRLRSQVLLAQPRHPLVVSLKLIELEEELRRGLLGTSSGALIDEQIRLWKRLKTTGY